MLYFAAMNKIIYCSILLFSLSACKNEDKDGSGNSGTDINVVSDFIKAALKRDYDQAKTYMIPDSLSLQRINNIARVNLSPEETKGLASAVINIHNVKKVNDSTTIVIYSNSFKNNWDTLRALRIQGKWLVDFNYYFDHDLDSLNNAPVNKPDSLK
jgi:hypothetical protein